MRYRSTLKLTAFVIFSLVFVGVSSVSAEEGTVAGAGTYSEDPSPTTTPEDVITEVPSPTPSVSPDVDMGLIVEEDAGFLQWILSSPFLWIVMALLATAIITVYLKHKNKDSRVV